METAGYEMKEVDHSAANKNFKTELESGMCIVQGVSNNKWSYRQSNGKQVEQELKYGNISTAGIDDSTQASYGKDADSGWIHLIAISNGNLLDFDLVEDRRRDRSGGGPATVKAAMWLRDDNQPDPAKGYMRTVLKVWRITKKAAPANDSDASDDDAESTDDSSGSVTKRTGMANDMFTRAGCAGPSSAAGPSSSNESFNGGDGNRRSPRVAGKRPVAAGASQGSPKVAKL